jgi:hypothetical protein
VEDLFNWQVVGALERCGLDVLVTPLQSHDSLSQGTGIVSEALKGLEAGLKER